MDDPKSPESILNSWYTHLSSSKVDLIGDIAGKEPFLIHGESLIRHCLEESPANILGESGEEDIFRCSVIKLQQI